MACLLGGARATLGAMSNNQGNQERPPAPSPASGSPAASKPGPLLGPVEIRRIAAELDLQPTKKLGQNFLHDGGTVRRIVAVSGAGPQDSVIEVGPGLGSLTLGLLAAGAKVTAIEIDPKLATQLPATAAKMQPENAENLTVVQSDALQVDAQMCRDPWGPPNRLIANLPYNVAVPILLHMLQIFPSLSSVLVMVQAEVADRLVAPPGTRTYGVPSVKAAWYGKATRAGSIGRTVFWPAPNVDSALVRLDVFPAARGDDQLRQATFEVVDAAFAQRRKMLRSALRTWVGDAEAARALFAQSGVDPTRRAETLTIEEFVALGQAALDLGLTGVPRSERPRQGGS